MITERYKPMQKLEVDDRRQKVLIRDPERVNALIIGAGSIGSVAAMLLARTGIGEIAIYDDDDLEEWNCTGGLFDRTLIGEPKVDAVASLVSWATGREISTYHEKFDDNSPFDGYDAVIIGVDSMTARRMIWNRLELDRSWGTYIDGRMGGHVAEVFTFQRRDREKFEWYQETLGVKVGAMACGTEATSYVMSRLTSMIGRSMRSVTNGERTVPFRQYWDAEHDQEFVSEHKEPERMAMAA